MLRFLICRKGQFGILNEYSLLQVLKKHYLPGWRQWTNGSCYADSSTNGVVNSRPLKYTNSGDVTGDKNSVVVVAAFHNLRFPSVQAEGLKELLLKYPCQYDFNILKMLMILKRVSADYA